MSEIKNNGAPTILTIGALGDVYTDISTGTQYKCTGSYNIAGHVEYEWKQLPKKDGEVKITPDPEPVEEVKEVSEPVVEPEVTPDAEPEPAEEVKEVVEEKHKNKNQNPNRNKSNNRTDYASKFKG